MMAQTTPVSEGFALPALLAGFAASPVPDIDVAGLAMDSRGIRPGYLFLACRGQDHHGLRHLADAASRGAVAVAYDPDGAAPHLPLADGRPAASVAVPGLGWKAGFIAARFFDDPSATQQVVAVTGTNGKTSVSTLTAQCFTDSGRACGVLGTLGFGAYGDLEPPTHTTPDAVAVQAWLARFHRQQLRYVSLEASSHALDQGRLNGVHAAIAVFTNLTRDHLDYHGTMEAYGRSKQRLFELPGVRHAVINLDDPFGVELVRSLPAGVQSLGYTFEDRSNPAGRVLQGKNLALSASGTAFDVRLGPEHGHVVSRLLGGFNAQNLMAVLGVLLSAGFAFSDAVAAVSRARTVPGRMECFGGDARPLAVVDYAHTPDALQKALDATRAHCRGALWCVFGCGGERDRGKRPQMGAIAERGADHVILTDDNPRHENGDEIIAEILGGMREPARAQVERDRRTAVVLALRSARPGDVVLVAGKGHEREQVTGDVAVPYSDRDTVMQILGGHAA